MYSESRGFYYAADLQGISDAEDNVRKARTNKQVAEYEKQIKSLQDAMESETKSIDDQIKKLNEYSEAWGKVSSKLEEAQNTLRATEVLGPDWETNIMSGLDLLNSFTEQYVNAQQLQKQAYLDARTAEANNPVNANGGGTVNTSGGNNGNKGNKTVVSNSTTTEEKKGENNSDANKNNYTFEGANFKTPGEAYKARADYIKAQGDAAYNNYLNSHGYSSSVPSSVQKPLLEAAQKAREDAEKEASKKHIHSLFMGTESAKRGKTLVGEMAPEIVVHNNGTASIVDKPTLINMKGGEKVFNGDETEKILKSKYVPMKQYNPKKFAMLHAFARGTSSPLQNAIAAQAVGIASGIKSGLIATTPMGGQTINQTFNITMPNITDASKADELFREFEQLSRRATQYYN